MFALALLLTGCGILGEESDATKDWSAKRLYEEARAARERGDYETAVDYYEKLESRFPFGRYAEQAQLEIAYAYYKAEEPTSAIAAAERFIKLHPRHPNVDYAYYIKGLANFRQGQGFIERYLPMDLSQRDQGAALQSFQDFAVLVERFPNSRYAQDARQRMIYLRNQLARYELHVADFYMRRKAYVAAANRAEYVIEHYDGSPAVPDALAIMAKAYKILRLEELSREALRVLKLNYPDHPGIREVEQLASK